MSPPGIELESLHSSGEGLNKETKIGCLHMILVLGSPETEKQDRGANIPDLERLAPKGMQAFMEQEEICTRFVIKKP